VPSSRVVGGDDIEEDDDTSYNNANSPVVFDDGLTEEIYVKNDRENADMLTVSSDRIGWRRPLRLVPAHGDPADRVDNSSENSSKYSASNGSSGADVGVFSQNTDFQINNSETAIYEDVEQGASFEYTPFGNGVKESIIIDTKDAPNTYSFSVNTGNLDAIITDEGEVLFISPLDRMTKYVIPTPVVSDAAGVMDEGAYYTLTEQSDVDGKDGRSYLLTLHLSKDYLSSSDRVFPIDADPTIEIYRKKDSLESLGKFASICSDNTVYTDKLYVGVNKDDGKHYRTYMKLDMPKIPAGCVVTEATLKLDAKNEKGSEKCYYAVSSPKEFFDEKGNWLKSKWSSQPLGKDENIPLSKLDIIDYGKGDDTLDITKAVRNWITKPETNTGLALIMSNETDSSVGKKKNDADNDIEYGLYDIHPKKSSNKPFFVVTYKDFTGCESYFSSHLQAAGSAGTSSVNDYTGRLTFVHQDAKSAGNRLTLSLSHVYDPAFGDRTQDKGWKIAKDGISSFGKHFTLSSEIRLLVPSGECSVKKYPYVYIDADGTKHYFKNKKVVYYENNSKKTAAKDDDEYPAAGDEDGLGLFVVPVTDKNLKDEYPLKIVDKSSSMSMYFDKAGYLGMVRDSNQSEDGGLEGREDNSVTYVRKSVKDHSHSADAAKSQVNAIREKIEKTDLEAAGEDAIIDSAYDILSDIATAQEDVLLFATDVKSAKLLDEVVDDIRIIIDSDSKETRGTKKKDALKKLDEILESDFAVFPERLEKVEDAAGITTELKYDDATGLLSSMSDPIHGGKEIKYLYDDNNCLVSVEHPDGSRADYEYLDGSLLSGVSDEAGKTLIYVYDADMRIVKICEYSYTEKNSTNKNEKKLEKNRIKRKGKIRKAVKKENENPDSIASGSINGQSILIDYSDLNKTVYTFSGADDVIDESVGKNCDDIENVYCFDNTGRCTSVYSRNRSDLKVISGVAYDYTAAEDDDRDDENKIKDAAVLGSTVTNYVTDPGFEDAKESLWIYQDDETDFPTDEKYMGKKSAHMKIVGGVGEGEMYTILQEVKVPFTGEYTASAYVKTKDMQNAHVRLSLKSDGVKKPVYTDSEGTEGEEIIYGEDYEGAVDEESDDENTDEDKDADADEDSSAEEAGIDENTPVEINDGYRRISGTINVKKGQVITLSLGLYGDKGEAWFDCVQVERGDLANQFNMLPNSGFEGDYTHSKKSDVTPLGWGYSNSQGEVDAKIVTEKELKKEPQKESKTDSKSGTKNKTQIVEGKKAIRITGNEDQKKVLAVDPHFGNEKASYTFSCYVKADCAPARGNRKVGVYVRGDYPDTGDDALDKYIKDHVSEDDLAPAAYAPINTSIEGWQYVSMALPARNWKGKLIEIRFDHECGSLMVDGCMLTRNALKTKTYTKTGKVKTSKSAERTTKYATDSRDRQKKVTSPGGAKTVYYYDKTNSVEKEKNIFKQGKANKVSYTSYTYDEYGNLTGTKTTAKGQKDIVTDSIYTSDGRFLSSTSDERGNEIKYDYDTINGSLKSLTDEEDIVTSYTYTGRLLPESVSRSDDKVSFVYAPNDQTLLKSIQVSDKLSYLFDHDAFGNVKSIRYSNDKAHPLVRYVYNKNNGKLNTIIYSDKQKEKIEYDDRELVSARDFGNGDRVSLDYDSKGRLARVIDENTNLKYLLDYDDAERLTTASVFDASTGALKTECGNYYDKAGRVSSFSYVTGGHAYTYGYDYTSDDKPYLTYLPSGGVEQIRYDRTSRLLSKEFTPRKNPATGEEKNEKSETGEKVTTSYQYFGTDRNGNDVTETKDSAHSTNLLSSVTTTIGDATVLSDSLFYSKTGRISGHNDVSYTYDKLGRLIEAKRTATDPAQTDGESATPADTATAASIVGGVMDGVSAVSYEYDGIGNITSVKTTLSSGKQSVEEYVYDGKNPDRLVSYIKDGNVKKIGKYKGLNPTIYGDRKLSWARGRELRTVTANKSRNASKQKQNKNSSKSASDADTDSDQFSSISYEYDYNGRRLAKTVDNKRTEFIINNDRILFQKTVTIAKNKKDKDDKTASIDASDNASELISFYYSASGTLLELGYSINGEKEHLYTVITNAMGDVVALYTPYGIQVGTYSYDPYGRITQTKHNDNYKDVDGILEKNPFRYRGYYYDTETGWYYLNSRYYDSEIKRFINGDDPSYLGAGDEINAYNLYVYCSDDPINGNDPFGCFDISGVSIGTGIALLGVAALMATTAPAWAVVAGVAAVTTGTVMAVTAAIDGVMAMDLSYSAPTVEPMAHKPAYLKGGGSLLLDFKNDEAVVYGHGGGGLGVAGGITYSVGEVFNYKNPKSYEGEFIDGSIGNTYGVDYCKGPNIDSTKKPASAISATFGSGKTLSGGYDFYTPGKILFSW